MCSTGSCSADRGYALVADDRLLRFTFSKSLADFLATRVAGARVAPARVRLGEVLPPGTPSPTGLYAVCKASTQWPLRVTLFAPLADRWRDPSRTIRGCTLQFG